MKVVVVLEWLIRIGIGIGLAASIFYGAQVMCSERVNAAFPHRTEEIERGEGG